MAVTFNGVDVPQQLVKLDCVQVTTGFGAVLRQVVAVADPEFPNQIMRVDSDGAVAITTASALEVTATTLPLPSGAATDTLQSTTNTLLDSIDDKMLTDTQFRASPLPLPTGAATAAKQPVLGTAGTPSADVISVQGVSGGEPLTVDVLQPVVVKNAPQDWLHANSNGVVTAKSGAGILRRIVVNTKGATSNVLTIYDGVTTGGILIASIDTVNGVGGMFDYELSFATGLTFELAGGTAADITVIFE